MAPHFRIQRGFITFIWFFGICGFLSFQCCSARGAWKAQNERLLDEVAQGHRVAREAIKTFSCNVEIFLEYPEKINFASGKYQRNGKLVLVKEGKEGVGTDHFQMNKNEIKLVGRSKWVNGKPTFFNAFRYPVTEFFCWCDAWRETVFENPGPVIGLESYEKFLEIAILRKPCVKALENNKEYIVVDLETKTKGGDLVYVKLWHDVRLNYLISKREMVFPKNKMAATTICEGFKEIKPGIFFPTKVINDVFKNGKIIQKRVTYLSNIIVNGVVPIESLALPEIPDGTVLEDRFLGIQGKVDSYWNLIGKPSKVAPAQKIPIQTEIGGNISQTESEKPSIGYLFWFFGSLGFVSTGVLLVYKLYRNQ